VTRIMAAALVVLALAATTLAVRGAGDASGDAPKVFRLGVGDTMEIEGAPIGCQVSRRDDRIALECRRAGKLKGTYVTIFDGRRVRVARFRSSDEAQVVFEARHKGRARMCGDAARASRAGACR
jgi:hypothetical protein